ncbi:MAG: acetate kinase [Halofilum sp. (in: g-proteobacteria)]|nr:acetate kinase [Halofilum sp. (in: g-proteobacteria)]
MKVLVINTGSSSIKYQLFDLDGPTVMAAGLVERIGDSGSRLRHAGWPDTPDRRREHEREQPIADHRAGMALIAAALADPGHGVLGAADAVDGVGHRVVHGGEDFQAPALIDEAVLAGIRANAPLAPLHNPANLAGIEVARELFPDAPQVAVFDTAFHQTMPPHAFHYALPRRLYQQHHVRRYGFHGTSHAWVAAAAAGFLQRPPEQLNLVTLHLGNGASATAIAGGRSVDTSMGLTPLEGLVMGTRSGDVDPAVHAFLAAQEGLSLAQIDELLNKHSGLKGLCGSGDLRDIERKAEDGDADAALALEIYVYRIRKYVGAYWAVLGRVDALVFTAGVGENSATIRARVCDGLQGLGIQLDAVENGAAASGPRAIHAADSAAAVLVVPTNEELAIAEQTREMIA